MHRQGYDLQLTQYDDRGWRATFYATKMEHSPTSATGTAWERTPWRATQRWLKAEQRGWTRRGGPLATADQRGGREPALVVTASNSRGRLRLGSARAHGLPGFGQDTRSVSGREPQRRRNSAKTL
jgi:hypothetical protein